MRKLRALLTVLVITCVGCGGSKQFPHTTVDRPAQPIDPDLPGFAPATTKFLQIADLEQSADTVAPDSQGFVSTTGVTNTVTNVVLQSQSFVTSPWVDYSVNGPTAPVLTADSAVAPDNSMTATQMVMPTVNQTGARSFLYQPLPAISAPSAEPYTASIYVKGARGGETLWLATSVPTFFREKIVATTSWQRFTLTWPNTANPTQYLEIGTDLQDAGQTATAAQKVYIWGAQVVSGAYAQTYIPTTTTAASQDLTRSLPAGLAFRDFSTLTSYAGNPVSPFDTGNYNLGGGSAPRVKPWGKIEGTYYGPTYCSPSHANYGYGDWINLCVYTSTDLLHWTDPGPLTNPIITSSVSGWDETYILHPTLSPVCSVAKYCMYYSGEPSNGVSPGIGLAISSDLKTWTKYGNAALVSTTTGGPGITNPMLASVIQIGSTLYMYTGVGCSSYCDDWLIYWTSPATDGINWTYGGVALSPPLPGDWDISGNYLDPEVFQNSHGFYEMIYTVHNTYDGSDGQELGYAISADGVNWFKYQADAILKRDTLAYPGTLAYVGDGLFFEDGGTFYVYYTASNCLVANGFVATMTDW